MSRLLLDNLGPLLVLLAIHGSVILWVRYRTTPFQAIGCFLEAMSQGRLLAAIVGANVGVGFVSSLSYMAGGPADCREAVLTMLTALTVAMTGALWGVMTSLEGLERAR